ncbi:LPS translocon maturation chaperone LptM [Paenirhodobacter sp.]
MKHLVRLALIAALAAGIAACGVNGAPVPPGSVSTQ